MIRFFCPNCNAKLHAPPEKIRASTKCPTCRNAVVVPNESTREASRKVKSLQERAPTWDYAEFRIDIPNPHLWACCISGGGAYTTAAATAYWWQSMQRWILPQLQAWLDEGWLPLTEVGPGGFTPRYFWPYFSPAVTGLSKLVDRVFGLVLFPACWWSWLIGEYGQHMKPMSFSISLRRMKRLSAG
jgi:hypothetical protein